MIVNRLCFHVRDVLQNPYHYSGVILARITVNVATMLWAAVVIVKADALKMWPGSALLGYAMTENQLAVLLLIMSCVASGRILFHSKPMAIGALLYAGFALLWMYVWASLVIAVWLGLTSLRPGQIACVTVVTCLSVFAFVANPKRNACGGSPAE